MRNGSRYVRLIALCVLVACSGAPGPTPSASGTLQGPQDYVTYFRTDALPHRTVVQAPADIVWRTLPGVFDELGYPGAPARSTRERVFITPNLQITGRLYEGESNSKYIDCGSGNTGPRADAQEVQFVIVTRVRPEGESETIVETIIDGSARDRMVSAGSYRCKGTGVLEKALVNLLILRLGT